MIQAVTDIVRWWYWRCPQCGLDHRHAGYLLPEPELHCELCVSEDGTRIRLRCWPAADEDHPRS